MTVTRSRNELQLSLPSQEGEGGFGHGLLASVPVTSPAAVPSVVWYDIRDQAWRGLVPSLSLFAEADTPGEVTMLLTEKVSTYIEDVQDQGLERDLVPRPLPLWEWRKLSLYFWLLVVRARLANALFPALAIPMPVVRRTPVYWRK